MGIALSMSASTRWSGGWSFIPFSSSSEIFQIYSSAVSEPGHYRTEGNEFFRICLLCKFQHVLVLVFLRRYVEQDAPVHARFFHRGFKIFQSGFGCGGHAALGAQFLHRRRRYLMRENVSMKIYNHAKNYTTFSRLRHARGGNFCALAVI